MLSMSVGSGLRNAATGEAASRHPALQPILPVSGRLRVAKASLLLMAALYLIIVVFVSFHYP
jgi:hypothetical protein